LPLKLIMPGCQKIMQEDHESSENISEAIKLSGPHWTTLNFACPRCGNPVRGSIAPPTAKAKAIYLTRCACNLPVFTEAPIETPEKWQAIFREIDRQDRQRILDKLRDPNLPRRETDRERTEEERAIRKRILDRLRNSEEGTDRPRNEGS
jgi:hypothetical protein